jgi:phosphate-selective porin OprO/OprP
MQGARYLLSVAYTGGKSTEAGTFDEQQALVGRASYLAVDSESFKWLVDADASHVLKLADSAPGPASPHSINLGTGPELGIENSRTVETGPLSARNVTQFGLETAVQSGRLYGEAGWFHYTVRRDPLPDPQFGGWYVESAFSLTGEPRLYDAITASFHNPEPEHPLGSPGGFGAWETAARFSRVDLDYRPDLNSGGVTGGVQDVWSLGLNWYPSAGLKFMLDYDNITVRHGEARARDISANAIALRSQIVF